MRRAIIHLGLPRTGTTSVQRVLTRLRPELAHAGILYPALTPRSAAEPHLSHQHLGETLDGRRPREERVELLDNLSGQLGGSDADAVLISYEHLCLVPPRRGIATLLAGFFRRHGFAMEILATIKPQAEFLNSTYTWRTQFLREKRAFVDFANAEMGHRTLDYAALFEPWRRVCDGRMTVLALRDPRSDQGLLARFLDAAGLDRARRLLTAEDLGLVENRSPGPVAVEVCRRLRAQGAQRRLSGRGREVTRFVEEACRQRGLDAVSFKGVDAGHRERIEARWNASNTRLAAVAWGEAWSARVARAPEAEINELARTRDPAGLHEADAVHSATCERFGLALEGGLFGFNPRRLFGRGTIAHAGR
jgi:hypothetical protein